MAFFDHFWAIFQKNHKKSHFFYQNVWWFKKKQYLCTRKTETNRLLLEILNNKLENLRNSRASESRGKNT